MEIIKPMLAYDSKGGKDFIKLDHLYVIEPKLDGVRMLVKLYPDGSYYCYSRNGKALETLQEYFKVVFDHVKVEEETILDGEVTGSTFKEINAFAHSKVDNVDLEGTKLTYTIFDVVNEELKDKDLLQRRVYLRKNFSNLNIIPALKIAFTSKDHLKYILQSYIDEGYEGMMLKEADSLYEEKKSKAWLKVKPSQTVDLKVVDVVKGTGKYKNTMGALIVESADGYQVKIGSGFTDSQRKEIWDNFEDYKFIVAEIKYQEITKNKQGEYSLRFPVFVDFRKDKETIDSLGKEGVYSND